ncbi:MAG: membrane dipeptidase [Anaerolineales bacterium]|nr:membrane dipeptidase [Anaerolineales bacterium]
MLIIDSHLDLAWNALQWNRDLLQSVYTLRTTEHAGPPGPGRGLNTVALPELRAGRVAVCFATLLARSTGIPRPDIDYGSPAQAFGVARGQLAYYRALEVQGHVRILTTREAFDQHWQEWEAWENAQASMAPHPSTALESSSSANEAISRSAQDATTQQIPADTLSDVRRPNDGGFAQSKGAGSANPPPLGLVISMESADPILFPEQVEDWHRAGVRAIGPAHYGPGRYAGGTGTERPLTPDGIALLKEMERLGIILDMTHFSDQAFWQAHDLYAGPILASHNNCRALVPHQRQFSDEQLRAILARDGVIGVAFDSWMLQLDWNHGVYNQNIATLTDVVNHIDHICQLAGNAHHAALGTDLDGGFGREESPLDLDTIADLQKIPEMLEARGYSETDIVGIMHGNWARFLRRVWTR